MNIYICKVCRSKSTITIFFLNNYRFIQCRLCKFTIIKPIPEEKERREYYKNFKYNTGFQNEKIIRKDARSTLSFLEQLNPNKGKILDVGCGAGFFLDEAQKQNWDCIGVDFANETINYGISKFNLNLITGDFLSIKFPREKYDVITLNQVIEHLSNPMPTLKKVHALLKYNGIVCIATPNNQSIMSKIQKENFNYIIPPEHIIYFSPQNFSKLLTFFGYKIIKIRTWSYPSDFAGTIKFLIKGKQGVKKNKSSITTLEENHQRSYKKRIKSFLFDKLISYSFHKLLNINNSGSMLEIYAQKV